jgi:hypothetical protein
MLLNPGSFATDRFDVRLLIMNIGTLGVVNPNLVEGDIELQLLDWGRR